jgi:transposase-like protein
MAWFYALLLFGNSAHGIRMEFIRKQLGLGTRSTARLCTYIRYQMASCARPAVLGGPGKLVHVDELHLQYFHGLRGAGEILWGCECEGQVLSCIIPDRKGKTILAAIERFVAPGSIIVTDQHASYKQLRRRGWSHVSINHSRAFHNFRGITNNPIETYWVTVRRTLRAYRKVMRENLWLYVAEMEFRYNRRHSETPLFDHLISNFPPVTPETMPGLRARYVADPSLEPYGGCGRGS